MSFIPITRKSLHDIKIHNLINQIYNNIVAIASNTDEKIYYHPIPNEINSEFSDPFYIKNMDLILNKLKILFSDSSIKHEICAKGFDGKIFDTSNINDKTLSLCNVL